MDLFIPSIYFTNFFNFIIGVKYNIFCFRNWMVFTTNIITSPININCN